MQFKILTLLLATSAVVQSAAVISTPEVASQPALERRACGCNGNAAFNSPDWGCGNRFGISGLTYCQNTDRPRCLEWKQGAQTWMKCCSACSAECPC